MKEPTPKPQIEKFKEAARDLQTDQSEEHFDEALKRVARPVRVKDQPKKKG